MPFINPDLISHMITCTANYDIVVPHTPEGFQPLHAIYARVCRSEIQRLLNKDLLKISSIYKGLRTRILEPDEISKYNTEGKVFFNINTRHDITEMGILP